VFSSLALAAVVAHPWGPGPGWLFFLVPLFWIGVIVLLAVIFGRRRRAMWAQGRPLGRPGRLAPRRGKRRGDPRAALRERRHRREGVPRAPRGAAQHPARPSREV